jgi:hypothetical protein
MKEERKKLCLIYANCQRDLIKSHLELSEDFVDNYDFGAIPYHFKAIQDRFIIPEEILEQTGLFIYQPVSNKYGKQSTDYILNQLPSDCLSISFPYIYFNGYHPQFTKLDSHNLAQRFLNDGSNLGDSNVITLVKEGYSAEEIVKKVREDNFYSSEFVSQNIEQTLAELGRREKETDIKIADFVQQNYQKQYLFYIPPHPANLIGFYVVNQILEKLAFKQLSKPHPVEQLVGVRLPIYPSVIQTLKLDFIENNAKYQPLRDREELSFERCIYQHIDTFQKRQESNNIDHCSQKILNDLSVCTEAKTSTLKVAILGGSNSLMRNGYTQYLKEYLGEKVKKDIHLNYFALGGVPNLYGAIQNIRNNIAAENDIIFFEYCVNDRSAIWSNQYSIKLAGLALEGFIRNTKKVNPNCRIIILVFGCNNPKYYRTFCQVSALYEGIAKRYEIPVINITELLLARKNISYIKSLYHKDDAAHYSRPERVKTVAQLITDEIITRNLINSLQQPLNKYHRVYADNWQFLKIYDDFNENDINGYYEKSVFKNSLFEENLLTIYQGASINLSLQGQLLSLILKSDWYDGFFKIQLGDPKGFCFAARQLITSSFSSWVTTEEKANINLITLPVRRAFKCSENQNLSISICPDQPEEFELDWHKTLPKVEPKDWKLSLIGIVYLGKIHQ